MKKTGSASIHVHVAQGNFVLCEAGLGIVSMDTQWNKRTSEERLLIMKRRALSLLALCDDPPMREKIVALMEDKRTDN